MDQEKIGKFIAECRKSKGLKQEDLAEMLNVSINAVSKWERGINLPNASIMKELADILGITLNELLLGNRLKDNEYKENAEKTLLAILEKHNNDIVKIQNHKYYKLFMLMLALPFLIEAIVMIFFYNFFTEKELLSWGFITVGLYAMLNLLLAIHQNLDKIAKRNVDVETNALLLSKVEENLNKK